MNGTPFSPACSAACTAGQVASITVSAPSATAAVNRGAIPASPSVTALVSTDATHPAPISTSVAKPLTGTPTSRNPRTRRRTSARTSAQLGNELSGGSATCAPSGTSAASASKSIAISKQLGHAAPRRASCKPRPGQRR